jgi:hypothetical protein
MAARQVKLDDWIERIFRVVEMTSILALLKVLARDWGKMAPTLIMAIGAGTIAIYIIAPLQRAYTVRKTKSGSMPLKSILIAFGGIMLGSMVVSVAVGAIAGAIENNLMADQRAAEARR